MRPKALLCALAIFVIFMAGFDMSHASAEGAESRSADSVIVYYFHTNFRCQNCHNMETWTKEVVETDFKPQVENGTIVLKIINTETKGNEHYMSDYGLFTKSVVLSLVKDGKEVKCANLAKVWDFLRSSDKFKTYVKDEISKYLKEL